MTRGPLSVYEVLEIISRDRTAVILCDHLQTELPIRISRTLFRHLNKRMLGTGAMVYLKTDQPPSNGAVDAMIDLRELPILPIVLQ